MVVEEGDGGAIRSESRDREEIDSELRNVCDVLECDGIVWMRGELEGDAAYE